MKVLFTVVASLVGVSLVSATAEAGSMRFSRGGYSSKIKERQDYTNNFGWGTQAAPTKGNRSRKQ